MVSKQRVCPACGKNRLCHPQEVKTVFRWKSWSGEIELLDHDDAQIVCSYCRAIAVGDDWMRLTSKNQRAYELSKSGSKTKDEYREILGSLPQEAYEPNRSESLASDNGAIDDSDARTDSNTSESDDDSVPRTDSGNRLEPTGGEW